MVRSRFLGLTRIFMNSPGFRCIGCISTKSPEFLCIDYDLYWIFLDFYGLIMFLQFCVNVSSVLLRITLKCFFQSVFCFVTFHLEGFFLMCSVLLRFTLKNFSSVFCYARFHLKSVFSVCSVCYLST